MKVLKYIGLITVLAATASFAYAMPITYSFEYGEDLVPWIPEGCLQCVDNTGAPLGEFSGLATFTYDDAILENTTVIDYRPGTIYPEVRNAYFSGVENSLLLNFDLVLGGRQFDETDIQIADFRFTLDGDLIGFYAGTGSRTRPDADADVSFFTAVGPAVIVAGNRERFEYQAGGVFGIGYAANLTKVNPVPEPATMLLLASGLIGIIATRRKFRK